MSTKKGIVKKVKLSIFSKPRKKGIYALKLDEGDELLHVILTHSLQDIMMFSDAGKVVRFNEKEVRSVGRTARGVKGMKIKNNHSIVDVITITNDNDMILTATQNGYGKRTLISKYRKTLRGSQGVISIATSKRNGLVVSSKLITSMKDDIILITDQGILIRTNVKEIRETSRSAQGVCLINIKGRNKLASIQVINAKDTINLQKEL